MIVGRICYSFVTVILLGEIKMKRKNDEFKFIGLDGFSEIESITFEPVKKSELKKPEKAKKKQSDSHKGLGEKLKASKKIPQPAHIEGGAREQVVYKKRVVIAVAASVTAAMLSLVTVASALDSSESKEPQNALAPAVISPATADEPVSAVKADKNDISGTSALYIDGELIGVVDDGEELKEALDGILADAKEGYDDTTTTEFANKVEVKPYTGNKDAESVDDLMEYSQYMYSIKLETDWIYEEEIPYETEITEDDSQPEDYEEITQEGQNGTKQTTLRLTFVNGDQTDAVVTGEKEISKPVNEKKIVGTAKSGGSGESTGNFMWPVLHTHSITSYMEWRWGRMHNGIDIAGGGDYGQPFVASDGGTVVWSGDDGGGYGNYVMIDHGNGYMTVYGHASELACSTGDYVSQGQVIGYIGSTGNSTGPHLHFEIRLDGEYQDPLNYVS